MKKQQSSNLVSLHKKYSLFPIFFTSKTGMISTAIIFSVMALSLFTALPAAQAASVVQSKNNKVLIDITGENVKVGDELFVVNQQNKRTAIIRVVTVKNQKAIADIVKGTAAVGNTTQAAKSGGAGASAAASAGSARGGGSGSGGARSSSPRDDFSGGSSAPATSRVVRFDQMKLGFQVKLIMDTMATLQQDNASPANTETVTMKGTNFGFGASLDIPLSGNFMLRGTGFYEMYNVKGTSQYLSCDGKTSTDCNANLSYVSLGGHARFDLMRGTFTPWIAAGGTLKMPLSKKSSALNESAIGMANTIVATIGGDIHMSNKSFIPLSFEYHYSLNKSDSVPTIDQMALTAGYGVMF